MEPQLWRVCARLVPPSLSLWKSSIAEEQSLLKWPSSCLSHNVLLGSHGCIHVGNTEFHFSP